MGQTSVNRIRPVEYAIFAVAALLVLACWQLSPADTTGLLNNTAKLGVTSLLVAMPISVALAWCLSKCNVPFRAFWESCLLVLLFLPLYIQLAAWEAGFGRGGWYSTVIQGQLSDPPLEGFRGAVWVHAIAAVPWLFWILRMGFSSIPATWEQSAEMDASPWQVFRHVTAPLAAPVFFASVLYVLIICATEITVTDRYQYRSYAEVLYNEYVLNSRFDALPLSARPIIALMMGVLVGGIALCRVVWPRIIHATSSAPEQNGVRRTNWLAFGFVATMVSFLLFLPAGNLVYQAGVEVVEVDVGRVRSWSLAKCVRIVLGSPIRFRSEIAWTAILSQLAIVFSIASSVLLCWWAQRKRWRQLLAGSMAMLCFVTPGTLIGLLIIKVLNQPSATLAGWLYGDTIFAPWLAITIKCFPFAYLVVWYGMSAIPRTLLEAAESDGARGLARLWHVDLPLLRPHLVCAVLVTLAVAVGELCASVLVMPPGVTTVATEIFSLIHYGAEDALAGLCLACLGVMVVITLFTKSALNRLLTTQTG